jgi:hypothetical protein
VIARTKNRFRVQKTRFRVQKTGFAVQETEVTRTENWFRVRETAARARTEGQSKTSGRRPARMHESTVPGGGSGSWRQSALFGAHLMPRPHDSRASPEMRGGRRTLACPSGACGGLRAVARASRGAGGVRRQAGVSNVPRDPAYVLRSFCERTNLEGRRSGRKSVLPPQVTATKPSSVVYERKKNSKPTPNFVWRSASSRVHCVHFVVRGESS